MLKSGIVLGIPAVLIYASNKIGIVPQAKWPKLAYEILMCIIGLKFGFPASIAAFSPVSSLPSHRLEPHLKQYERVYFSKGL